MFSYVFPRCRFADSNTEMQQLLYVESEMREAFAASDALDRDREMVDILHAIETYLWIREKEMGPLYIVKLYEWVSEKNRERGYYNGN